MLGMSLNCTCKLLGYAIYHIAGTLDNDNSTFRVEDVCCYDTGDIKKVKRQFKKILKDNPRATAWRYKYRYYIIRKSPNRYYVLDAVNMVDLYDIGPAAYVHDYAYTADLSELIAGVTGITTTECLAWCTVRENSSGVYIPNEVLLKPDDFRVIRTSCDDKWRAVVEEYERTKHRVSRSLEIRKHDDRFDVISNFYEDFDEDFDVEYYT